MGKYGGKKNVARICGIILNNKVEKFFVAKKYYVYELDTRTVGTYSLGKLFAV